MKTTMHPVKSSNIAAVGYAPEGSGTGTLHVQFLSSGTEESFYSYADVPEGVFQELLSAASCGQFFARVIKGVYPGVRQ